MLSWKIFIPCLFLGFIASCVLIVMTIINSPYGLTSIEYNEIKLNDLPTKNDKELVRGSFVSPNDYLGIFFVPFKKIKSLPETPISLKVYEKSSRRLVHTHTYVAKNLTDKALFPFGIPTITQSKGIEYEFVISSDGQNSKLHSLKLDLNDKIETVHLFDRRKLSRHNIWGFLTQKLFISLKLLTAKPFVVVLLGSLAFPFVLWALAKVGLIASVIAQSHLFWVLGIILFTTVLILTPRPISDGIYIFWIFMYLAVSIFLKQGTRTHYLWALILLLLCPLFLAFSDDLRAEKSAILVFFFLCFGVGHEFINIIRFPSRYNEADELT